jgi:hypothetical protein
MNELVTADGEILETTMPVAVPLAVGLMRAEIDTQIETAKRFPRSIQRATGAILTLATMDEETAAECNFALPRGGKPILGPSIRLAEIIQQCWGNCRVSARVVNVNHEEKWIEAEGIYHDLETNSATAARVRRRIADRSGRLFNDDMIIVTGNAACSIAKRNAILAGVPKSVWRQAYDASRKVVAGDVQTLSVRREKAVSAFSNFGVKPEQVFAAIGVAGNDDITLDHIPILRGMFAAIKNGEATVEEVFATKTTAGPVHQVVKNALADEPPPPAPDRPTGAASEQSATSQAGGEKDSPAPAADPAFEAGAKAAASGLSRKGAPAKIANVKSDHERWLAGYDSVNGGE